MGVHLINKDERYTAPINGVDFFYRRLPATTKARLVKENTNRRGVVDYEAVGLAALAYGTLGWDGVTGDGPDGKPVEVTFEKKLLGLLPEETRGELVELIIDGKLEDIDKALDPTRTSATTTELS